MLLFIPMQMILTHNKLTHNKQISIFSELLLYIPNSFLLKCFITFKSDRFICENLNFVPKSVLVVLSMYIFVSVCNSSPNLGTVCGWICDENWMQTMLILWVLWLKLPHKCENFKSTLTFENRISVMGYLLCINLNNMPNTVSLPVTLNSTSNSPSIINIQSIVCRPWSMCFISTYYCRGNNILSMGDKVKEIVIY